jgi:hypothetical protein
MRGPSLCHWPCRKVAGDMMERMPSKIAVIYDVLFRPSEAFRALAVMAPWGLAVGAFVLSTVLPSLVIWAGVDETMVSHIMGLLLFGEVIGSLICWVLSTGIYHFAAEIAGGQGRMVSLFTAFGLAHLPRLTILPLFVLSGLLSGGWQTLWLAVATLVILGWTWTLYYYAVKEIYCLSGTKTVLVLFSPFLAGLLIVVVIVAFFSAWFAQFSLGHW